MVKSKPSMTGRMAGRSPSPESFDEFIAKYAYEVAGSTYIDKPSAEFREMARNEGLNPYTSFQVYVDDNDDYGKADVVSSEELDRMIAAGATEVFRGMPDDADSTGAAKLEQPMYGKKYYIGQGIYGDGLYFADDINVAGWYASSFGAEHSSPNTGSIARAAVKPGAKIGAYFDVVRQMDADGYQRYFDDYAAVSAYARSRGYDILTSIHSGEGLYYTVLNRGALVFSDKLGTVAYENGKPAVRF